MPGGRTADIFPGMNIRRVLVTLELVSYREAISLVLAALRPDAEIHAAEPGYLDRETRRQRPDLVVCSEATDLVRDLVPSWIQLHPECDSRSFIHADGETFVVEDLQLDDILALVDEPRGPLEADRRGRRPKRGR